MSEGITRQRICISYMYKEKSERSVMRFQIAMFARRGEASESPAYIFFQEGV